MKKNYFTRLLVLLFGLCFIQKGFAQLPIVANDDVVNSINSSPGGFFYNTFLSNDTLNGNGVSTSSVNVEQVSTTNLGVYITLGGVLYITPGTSAGTYTIVYKICQSNFTSNCDTATITVNVCNQPAPTIVPQTCNMPADEIMLNNLPATGTWTITLTTQWPSTTQTFTGTGTTFTIPDLVNNYYSIQVTDSGGCVSPMTGISVGYLGGLDTSTTGTYQDLNNDGIVNIGDIIDYQVTINNTATCELNDVEVEYEEWGGVATVFGSPVASIPAGEGATVTVFYPLTQTDINAGYVMNWFAVRGDLNGYEVYTKASVEQSVMLNIPDGFKFNAFIDENANGTQESNEEDFTLGYFTYTVNDGDTVHTLYGSDPIVYESGPFLTYDVTFVLYPEYANFYNLVTATYIDVSIVGNPGVTTYNFPITTIPYQDVAIHLYSGSTATPGFPFINYITYTNNGNQTLATGTVTLLTNATAFPITSTEAITTNADGFTFNFTNLLPFESRTMMFSMQVPTIPTVALGDVVGNGASISMPEGDVVPVNNFSLMNTTIVGSYDPNDKAEINNGEILHDFFTQNDYLNYTIRFENTGTANAFTVKVTDVLDDKLDEASIRMIGASHEYSLERIGSELTWTFNNIQLPPSVVNTQTGHGYIAFKVKPKAGYAVGDIIENTADIYFDFNPAIVTNTTYTEFFTLLKIEDFASNELKVYPNPVKDLLNIVSNSSTVETITVHDMLGKTVLSKTVNGTSTMIDVAGLSNGIYLVKVTAAHGEKVFKIIKE